LIGIDRKTKLRINNRKLKRFWTRYCLCFASIFGQKYDYFPQLRILWMYDSFWENPQIQ